MMRLKAIIPAAVGLCVSIHASAQQKERAILKGRLINKETKAPINNLRVTLPDFNAFSVSQSDGTFSLPEVPFGTQKIIVSGAGINGDTLNIAINKELVDVADIEITPSNRPEIQEITEIPTIALDDNNNSQDDGSTDAQNVSGLFPAGQDPFLRAASFTFGQYYFKVRGQNNSEVQVNGITTEDIEKGYANWSHISGFNNLMYNRDITFGLWPSSYAYGGTNGTVHINATAADQRPGTTVSYQATNRNYRNRVTATHSSGLTRSGWAYSVSASHRWAEEGYRPGTFYDGYSFYGGVTKALKKSMISLTAMASPTTYGKTQWSTLEPISLSGDNYYNPAWGYQNGKKRNSRVVNTMQPMIIANYNYTPNDRTRWTTSLGYEFGKYKTSAIDRYNAYSERGDYYRNLPSYYLTGTNPKSDIAAAVDAQLRAHPEQLQINWDGMYNANYTNYETLNNVDGIAGKTVYGRRSMYVLSNYVDDLRKLTFNTNFEHSKNEYLTLYGGLRFTSQDDRNYRELADLLGGDYYLNYNQFADQHTLNNPNYSQNDLNNPNKPIYVGDKYGYDYMQSAKQGEAWGQVSHTGQHIDAFAALDLGFTSLSRTGYMRNGLFPDNSFGKSASHNFLTYKAKAGVSYKFDMRNMIYLNADYSTDAPTASNTYISISTRDFVVNNPTTIKTKTVEGGYMLTSPILSARITGYLNDMSDYTMVKRFFNDDLGTQTFVSYVMNNVAIRSIGTEFAANLKISSAFSLTGVMARGKIFYNNRPTVSVYRDNDPTVSMTSHTVYIQNYYLGNGPQSIYHLSLNYKPGKRWFANINFNYFDDNYIQIYPERRTPGAAQLVTPGSSQWHDIYDQEKLPGAFTVDLHAGKTYDLHKIYRKFGNSSSLVLSAGIYNMLNKTDIKVTGEEQLRYNFTNRNPGTFANYYIYAPGINFYASVGVRF